MALAFETLYYTGEAEMALEQQTKAVGHQISFSAFILESIWLFLEHVGFKGKVAKQCLLLNHKQVEQNLQLGRKAAL